MSNSNSQAPAGGPAPPPRTSSHRSTNTQGASSRRAEGSSSRPQPGHSRSATAVGQPPVGTSLPREESTVINRIGVSDPQDDIAREQARQQERAPVGAGADLTPITGLGLVGSEGVDDGGRGAGKSRQDHSKSEGSAKRTKFGNYILGQTLGEGEFGKVKMGWKRDSSVEVAIKLIRRETLGSNSNRLAKIYREIHILRGLDHPNIVRLHEMVETERHIGIILEYASGGELFDYILNHRYLKDGPARKLFAQLISGVGYLHKRGIVHRDLKLENLLLDRNKNIIITDFGFANTFDPKEELSEEIEYRLGDKDFIRQMGLDQPDARRGDLMQTSCGSPCYAAPELVVSDSLYTGCKVDVWSCGVILVSLSTPLPHSQLTVSSTPCWPVICLSTTIRRTQRVTTSTSCTSTLFLHRSPSPNMSHRMRGTCLSAYSCLTQESAPTCSRSLVTAG
jgi:protein-serine/threonine kinase